MDINCDICDTPFELATYSDGECPNCKQKYEYEEGTTMVLTYEQVEVLKKHYKDKLQEVCECKSCKKEIHADAFVCPYCDADQIF